MPALAHVVTTPFTKDGACPGYQYRMASLLRNRARFSLIQKIEYDTWNILFSLQEFGSAHDSILRIQKNKTQYPWFIDAELVCAKDLDTVIATIVAHKCASGYVISAYADAATLDGHVVRLAVQPQQERLAGSLKA